MSRPGLYLHVPYCSAICPYCDFAVLRGDAAKGTAFVDSLLREIAGVRSGKLPPEAPELAAAVERLAASRFDTVYYGGGTPSILDPIDLVRLFRAIDDAFDLAPGTRFFFEANPEDVTPERAATWRALGVSMLSLGVQALDDATLDALGRRHTARDAARAATIARDAGFETVSIDLIYGLPENSSKQQPDSQSASVLESWDRQLDRALDLPIDHLSLYELEIHERTVFGKRFARGELEPLGEDERAELFRRTHERLAAAGFEGYEVSNFARAPEHRSAHNAKYWHHVPYLGLGPSAHSLVVDEEAGAWRFWNARHEQRWRRHLDEGESPAEGWERLPASALLLEAAMLGLRTRDGLDLDHVERLTGVDLLATRADVLAEWIAEGLLFPLHDSDDRRLRPTIAGMSLADRLAAELA